MVNLSLHICMEFLTGNYWVLPKCYHAAEANEVLNMSSKKITCERFLCSRINDYVAIEKRYTKSPGKPQQCKPTCRDAGGCSNTDCTFVGGTKNYLEYF